MLQYCSFFVTFIYCHFIATFFFIEIVDELNRTNYLIREGEYKCKILVVSLGLQYETPGEWNAKSKTYNRNGHRRHRNLIPIKAKTLSRKHIFS